MKPETLLIVVAFFACRSSVAQDFFVKLGIAHTTADFTKDPYPPSYDYSYRTGLVGGIGLVIPVDDVFFIQPEMLYHQKGWKSNMTNSNGTKVENQASINYFETLVLGRMQVKKFHILLGPSFSYGVNGKYRSTYSRPGEPSMIINRDIDFGEPDYFDPGFTIEQRMDIGMQGGIGMNIWRSIVVDLRYARGFVNFYDEEMMPKSRNVSWQFTVATLLKQARPE